MNRPWRSSMAIVGACALLLAGCAMLPGAESTPDPLQTPEGAGRLLDDGELPAARQLTESEAAGGESMPWEFLGFADDTHRVIRIFRYTGGGCVHDRGVLVTEQQDATGREQIIVGSIGDPPPLVATCTADARLQANTVTLPEALTGDVALLHLQRTGEWTSPAYDF